MVSTVSVSITDGNGPFNCSKIYCYDPTYCTLLSKVAICFAKLEGGHTLGYIKHAEPRVRYLAVITGCPGPAG